MEFHLTQRGISVWLNLIIFFLQSMVASCTEEKEVTVTVRNRKPVNGFISCGDNSYIFINEITGLNLKSKQLVLTDSELPKIRDTCTCRKHCSVPGMETNRTEWYIKIQYKCIDGACTNGAISTNTTQICERKTGTISCLTIQGTRLYITNATYGRTSKNICKHRREGRTSNTDCRANSLSVVRKLCQNKTFCKLKPTNKVFSDPCSGTYKYLELMFECKLVDCGETVTVANGDVDFTNSKTTYGALVNVTCRTGYMLSGKHSSIKCLSNRSWSNGVSCEIIDGNGNTVAIFVPVSVVTLLIAGCIIGLIVYVRWRRGDGICEIRIKNTSKHIKRGIINRTYSKEIYEVDALDNSDNIHSHTSDGVYTDLHSKDRPNDYYAIADHNKEIADNFDEEYYVIEDKNDGEYNKISFTTKIVLDDPNYGLTFHRGNQMDETYDHVEVNCPQNTCSYGRINTKGQVEATILNQLRDESNDYDHLHADEFATNFSSQENDYSRVNPNIMANTEQKPHTAITKTQNSMTELQQGASEHNYFVLEKNESSKQLDESDQSYHSYFTLNKEIGNHNELHKDPDRDVHHENTPI